MTVIAKGKQTGAFPAPGSAAYLGLVHKIIVNPDPSATGYVSVQSGGITLKTFNKPPTTGSEDDPFVLSSDGGNALDPTLFSISATVGGEGAFVSYLLL